MDVPYSCCAPRELLVEAEARSCGLLFLQPLKANKDTETDRQTDRERERERERERPRDRPADKRREGGRRRRRGSERDRERERERLGPKLEQRDPAKHLTSHPLKATKARDDVTHQKQVITSPDQSPTRRSASRRAPPTLNLKLSKPWA